MTAEVIRRCILFVSATLVLAAVLFYSSGSHSTIPDTLPSRLSDGEFWHMVTDFSEPGGYFRSENFLSNESGYQNIIPTLRKTLAPGGVYLGVGPEQNFTYIVALEPKMAFVIDIRRQNMLEQLFYKALMETSADRAEFLSQLFSRTAKFPLKANAAPEALIRSFESGEGSPALFNANVARVVDYLEKQKGFELSEEDEAGIRHVAQAFFDSGPDLTYTFIGGYSGYGGFRGMPTYSDLMTETDGVSRNWNFLATEDQFHAIQRLQKNNVILPLVGDFAGPKAIRAVARYARQHGAMVRVFYTSNVEQYLFQDEGNWRRFYENVAVLPVDSTSTFIRYVLNGWGFRRQRRSLISPIDDTVRAYRAGRIRAYYDVVDLSR
jgi:hypothetical protein